ncbi:MAG: hypothetical protein R2822_15985 [Spirosomataceae bacterium]
MTPTLTDDQISQLYRYVANQGVSYYDVQVELVDHIATEIERQIEQNPEELTEHIFDKILTKFRYYDFEGLENRKKQVQRQYRRFFWRSFTSFLLYPK